MITTSLFFENEWHIVTKVEGNLDEGLEEKAELVFNHPEPAEDGSLRMPYTASFIKKLSISEGMLSWLTTGPLHKSIDQPLACHWYTGCFELKGLDPPPKQWWHISKQPSTINKLVFKDGKLLLRKNS